MIRRLFLLQKKRKILLFCYISYRTNIKTPKDKLFSITNKTRIIASLLVAQFQDPIPKGQKSHTNTINIRKILLANLTNTFQALYTTKDKATAIDAQVIKHLGDRQACF